MGYISFYRKWRPQNFDQVIGQDYNIKAIRNAISKNRLSHSYIFCGPRGTGKTSTARIMAKAINCKQGMTEKPCNKCESCIGISNGNSIDVIEIDAASNRGINEIRELREKVKYLPNILRKKVYIIDEIHMLTTEAFNALLKVLEEPPEHVVFIMATTEPNKVIPTIMSRCQRFDFYPITQQEIKERLKVISREEKITISDSALSLVAKYADGSLRDADGILEQLAAYSDSNIQDKDVISLLGTVDFELLNRFAEVIHSADINNGLEMVNGIINSSCNLKVFVSEFLDYLYDLYIYKNYENPRNLVNVGDDYSIMLQNQAEQMQKEELEFYLELFTDLLKQIRWGDGLKTYFKSAVLKAINFIVLNEEGLMERNKIIEAHLEKMKNRINEISLELKDIKNARFDGYKAGGEKSGNFPKKVVKAEDIELAEENSKDNKEEKRREEIKEIEADPNISVNTTEEKALKVKAGSSDASGTDYSEIDIILRKCDKIFEALKRKKIPVYAMFKESHPLKVEGNTLYFILKNDLKWHKEHLNKTENTNLISETIKEITGKKFKVLFELEDPKETGVDSESSDTGRYDIPEYSEENEGGLIRDYKYNFQEKDSGYGKNKSGKVNGNRSGEEEKAKSFDPGKINKSYGSNEINEGEGYERNGKTDKNDKGDVYEYFEKKFKIKE